MMKSLKSLLRHTASKWMNRVQLSSLGLLLLNPSISHAITIESIVSRTTSYLQGGIARSIGVLAVVVMGYLCLVRHKFPKEYLMMVLVGLGIIFGGSSLYNSLVG